MTIDQAIAHLRLEYDKALSTDWVRKPLAWAFYQTWKYVDVKEKRESKDKGNHDKVRQQEDRC